MRIFLRAKPAALLLLVSTVLVGFGLRGLAAPQGRQTIAQRPANITQAPGEYEQVKQRLRPLAVGADAQRQGVTLRTDSPYYAGQISDRAKNLPMTLLEVDHWNNAYRYLMTGGEMKGPPPVGVDETRVVIEKTAKTFDLNFRYSTIDKAATGVVWQVSRVPFPADPVHWQNSPGQVGSGPAVVFTTQKDGFHYFLVNFARVADHNPAQSPYYEGTVSAVQPTQPATQQKAPAQAAATAPPPAPRFPILQQKPPERGQGVIAPPRRSSRNLSGNFVPAADQTFYVRVVPIHADKQAGVPSVPVKVTVARPHPCPTTTADITIRPPSTRIVWYMRPNFFDSLGDAHNRWYAINGSTFLPVGLHQMDQPKSEEKSWWQKVVDTFTSVVNYFANMMTALVTSMPSIEQFAVDLAATSASVVRTGGQIYNLNDCPVCKDVLKAGLRTTMASCAIPPALTTGPELMGLSTEFLVQTAAVALGKPELYDAYKSLPDDVKSAMQGDAENVARNLIDANARAMRAQIEAYTCTDVPDLETMASQGFFHDPNKPAATRKSCVPRIPDPIFNSVHPATVMVYVENPNNEPTDAMVMDVSDAMGIFNAGSVKLPSLAPGEKLSIPVVMVENIRQFLDINGGPCSTKNRVTIQGQPSCEQQKWYDLFFEGGEFYRNPKVRDTFKVSFTIGQGYSQYSGLDATSSGTPLKTAFTMDKDGKACGVSGAIRYPQGWKIWTPAKSIVPETWDDMFDEAHPNPNNGMLRKTPAATMGKIIS